MHDAQIPIGPQSPIMKEPICIRIQLDGNTIQDSWIKMGYIHRGMEKLLESISFTASETPNITVKINVQYVKNNLENFLIENKDHYKFIL